MASVLAGEGTILSVTISSTVTPIANVTEVDGAEISAAAIPTTALAAVKKTYRPSKQPDPGQVTFKIEFDPSDTTHALLAGRAATPAAADDAWRLTYNDANTTHAHDDWHGFVTKFKRTGFTEDNNVMAELTIQCTDFPVFTAGTP